MMSQRTEALYRAHRPAARPGGFLSSLADLIQAVEVGAKVSVSNAELVRQIGIDRELFESIARDVGLQLD